MIYDGYHGKSIRGDCKAIQTIIMTQDASSICIGSQRKIPALDDELQGFRAPINEAISPTPVMLQMHSRNTVVKSMSLPKLTSYLAAARPIRPREFNPGRVGCFGMCTMVSRMITSKLFHIECQAKRRIDTTNSAEQFKRHKILAVESYHFPFFVFP